MIGNKTKFSITKFPPPLYPLKIFQLTAKICKFAANFLINVTRSEMTSCKIFFIRQNTYGEKILFFVKERTQVWAMNNGNNETNLYLFIWSLSVGKFKGLFYLSMAVVILVHFDACCWSILVKTHVCWRKIFVDLNFCLILFA